MDSIEAKERAESMGKTEKLDKKGENYQRLTEKEKLKKISEDKVKKMLEVILKTKSDDGEIREQLPTVSSTIIVSLIKKLVKLLKTEGINDVDSMCKKIKEYWDE